MEQTMTSPNGVSSTSRSPSDIEVPARIRDRVEVEVVDFGRIPKSHFREWSSDEVFLTASLTEEEGMRLYTLKSNRNSPEFAGDADAFFTLLAQVLAANVRRHGWLVKDLTWVQHRIIDEYSTDADRRFIRRTYLTYRYINDDKDGWKDGPEGPDQKDA